MILLLLLKKCWIFGGLLSEKLKSSYLDHTFAALPSGSGIRTRDLLDISRALYQNFLLSMLYIINYKNSKMVIKHIVLPQVPRVKVLASACSTRSAAARRAGCERTGNTVLKSQSSYQLNIVIGR